MEACFDGSGADCRETSNPVFGISWRRLNIEFAKDFKSDWTQKKSNTIICLRCISEESEILFLSHSVADGDDVRSARAPGKQIGIRGV